MTTLLTFPEHLPSLPLVQRDLSVWPKLEYLPLPRPDQFHGHRNLLISITALITALLGYLWIYFLTVAFSAVGEIVPANMGGNYQSGQLSGGCCYHVGGKAHDMWQLNLERLTGLWFRNTITVYRNRLWTLTAGTWCILSLLYAPSMWLNNL